MTAIFFFSNIQKHFFSKSYIFITLRAPNILTMTSIYLADDDHEDNDFFATVLAELDPSIKLRIFPDGVELIEYLSKDDAVLPDVLLLDLNMPKKNGIETLQEIRKSIKLESLPVIIFSTSSSKIDIAVTFQLKATAYIVKPPEFNKLQEAIQSVMSIDFSKWVIDKSTFVLYGG